MHSNPYTPSAGHLPPVLAGRDQLLRGLSIGLGNVASSGRPHAQDVIMVGPCGVGKTVTLTTYGQIAATAGFEVVNLQAVAGSSGLVESLLQRVASRVAANAGPWVRAKSAFDRIAGMSFGLGGVSAQIATHEPSRGSSLLDPGTLAEAVVELANEVKRDAPTGGLLITVDEVQVASAADLAPDDARFAIIEPARRAGVNWHPSAAGRVVEVSNSYPAHLQQLAHTVWDVAAGPSEITPDDVGAAIPQFETQLHRRTLGPRWDRMSDRQMEYLAAIALLGGQTTAPRLAVALGRPVQELSWIRQDLIQEGDIYSVQRGHVALTVPIFAPYILTRYEQARQTADIPLLSLEDMRRNSTSNVSPNDSARAPDPRTAPLTPPSPYPQADGEAERDRRRRRHRRTRLLEILPRSAGKLLFEVQVSLVAPRARRELSATPGRVAHTDGLELRRWRRHRQPGHRLR